jgi:hypothetical protein
LPDESDFLCGDWVWDSALREMRHYPRVKKGHAAQPDAVERLESARAVRLHLWSQQPMQTSTGQVMPASQARVVVEYQDGRTLDINEPDRGCAERLASMLAAEFGLAVGRLGAPTGRRGGNLPRVDSTGRLVYSGRNNETVLDESAGTVQFTKKKRFFRKDRREIRTNDIRTLELTYDVSGPSETFTVVALTKLEDRFPIASYTGLEGWADPEEWSEWTRDLGRRLGVEVALPKTPLGYNSP